VAPNPYPTPCALNSDSVTLIPLPQIVHYAAMDRAMQSGDVLLMDAGACSAALGT